MKKYAVITGASSGIGVEFAKRLAKQGYKLVLTARRKDRLEKLAKQLKTECEIVTADLTKEQDCYKLFEAVEDKPVSVFINNAGFGNWGPFTESDLNKELSMIKLNVQAVHILTKLMLKKMEKQGYGSILNVASSAGLIPAGPYMSTYYATKIYVTSLTRAIAEELRDKGSSIYIGCLCPGPVDTEFNDVADVEFSLKGINASYCAGYALAQMEKRKVVIIPTFLMKSVIAAEHLVPQGMYIHIVRHQQKKKGK